MSDKNDKTKFLPIAMCMGVSLGCAFGLAIDNLAIGMCLGLSIGVAVGIAIDSKNKNGDK